MGKIFVQLKDGFFHSRKKQRDKEFIFFIFFLAQISIKLVLNKYICSREPFSPGQYIAHFYMFMVCWSLNEITDIYTMRVFSYLQEIKLNELALFSHMKIWQVWRLFIEDLSHGDRPRRIMEESVRKKCISFVFSNILFKDLIYKHDCGQVSVM